MDPWLVAFGSILALLVISSAVIGGRRAATHGHEVAALRTRIAGLEDQLAADRHEHDLLTESLTQGVISIDGGLRIAGANSAAHHLLGRPEGALIGQTVIEAFLDIEVESIARAALKQGSATAEFVRTEADGRRVLVRAQRSLAGGAWLVLEDVSELRRLQRIRTEFIDNLSHELRTPLTTVSVLAETLTREADVAGDAIPARMRERIGKIEIETGHLVQMVSELLDLSRIESGGTIGALELLDLGRLATESLERLRLFADRQGVVLRVDRPAVGPAVRGDEERLGQVFVNLLHNAVKFSPDGGDVMVTVRHETGRVVTSVADHGVGIPRAAQGRIFERFYKVDRARVRGEAGGTGLGLAIARHIIEQHGGTIWVDSTEGVGSTFSFALPISLDHG